MNRGSWWVVLAATTMFAFVDAETLENIPLEALSWATLLLSAVVFHALWRRRNRELNLMDPGVIVSGYYFIRYSLGMVIGVYWKVYDWFDPLTMAAFDAYSFLAKGHAVCKAIALGALGLYLGFTAISSRIARRKPDIRPNQKATFALLVAAGCLVADIVVIRFVPVVVKGILQSATSFSMVLIPLATVFAIRERQPGTRIMWMSVVALGMLQMGLGTIVSGMREGAIKAPILLMAGFYIANRRIPWALIGSLAGLTFIVILPLLNQHKKTVQSTTSSIVRMEAPSGDLTYAERLEVSIASVLTRFNSSLMLSAYVQHYPEAYDFETGRTFWLTLQGMVPRLFWPDKPEISVELNRYPRKVGLVADDDDETSAVFDAVSEYYLNFGFVGVLLMCIVHGYYLTALNNWLIRETGILAGSIVFFAMTLANHDFFGVFSSAIFQTRMLASWLAMALIIGFIQVKKAKQRKALAAPELAHAKY